MTIKTLKAKIKKYKEVKAEFDELEKVKKELASSIIDGFKEHEKDKLNGLQLVSFTREYLNKNSGIPSDIWNMYATPVEVEQLRNCKA